MSGDEMELIDPKTMGRKLTIGKDNIVVDDHECTFSSFDEDSTCTICGKKLGDHIAEDADPNHPRIPIILVPKENNQNE